MTGVESEKQQKKEKNAIYLKTCNTVSRDFFFSLLEVKFKVNNISEGG
jgi:hypothetical protein